MPPLFHYNELLVSVRRVKEGDSFTVTLPPHLPDIASVHFDPRPVASTGIYAVQGIRQIIAGRAAQAGSRGVRIDTTNISSLLALPFEGTPQVAYFDAQRIVHIVTGNQDVTVEAPAPAPIPPAPPPPLPSPHVPPPAAPVRIPSPPATPVTPTPMPLRIPFINAFKWFARGIREIFASAPAGGEKRCPCILDIIPFEHCKRPIDEITEGPCNARSENGGFVQAVVTDGGPVEQSDNLWIVFKLVSEEEMSTNDLKVIMDVFLLPHKNCPGTHVPVQGLTGVVVPPKTIAAADPPTLQDDTYECSGIKKYIAEIPLNHFSGQGLFTFCELFEQTILVKLTLYCKERRANSDQVSADIFDHTEVGSLLRKIFNVLLPADAAAQGIPLQYHPWYPVLAIGSEKARQYMIQVARDFKLQKKNFGDPVWLMLIGKYLDILTGMGIIEAARQSYPNLLNPIQRHCYTNGCQYSHLRQLVDVAAWQRIWDATHTFHSYPYLQAYSTNILDFASLGFKYSAVSLFLEQHHKDLRTAMYLAGGNPDCGQKTWQTVFRTAERAVQKLVNATGPTNPFPELQNPSLLAPGVGFTKIITKEVIDDMSAMMYRQSMNDVAEWARQNGYMNFTGNECIPSSESLIQSGAAQRQTLEQKDGAENVCR